jgi:uncharacterized protein (TIGR03032 family)
MNRKMNIPDFFCTYSKEFPEIIKKLNVVVGFTTIDANKVVFLRIDEKNNVVQFLRNSDHPMGMSLKKDQLALATRSELQIFKTNQELAKNFPEHKGQFDKVFLPKITYHCGNIDLHDLVHTNSNIIGVSSAYSCLVEFSSEYSYVPVWKPNFIDELVHEDRCHLNGVACENGEIQFVTALGKTNQKEGWRKNIVNGGIVIDYKTNEIVIEGLSVPHSPIISGNHLFVALSGTGEIMKYNLETKHASVIANLSGYIRGMQIFDDYLFVGLSKLRNKSSNAFDIPISKKQLACGISILSKHTGELLAELRYEKDINEIYSIQIFPQTDSAILFTKDMDAWKYSVDTSLKSFWMNK